MGAASRTGEKVGEAGVVVVSRKEAGSDGSVGFFVGHRRSLDFILSAV